MKERIIQPKKATTNSFSIPALRQPTRGFGSQSSDTSSQPALNKPLVHDISRIPLRRPQAKLTVNQPGDIYEQQADTVAQQVVGRLEQLGNRSSIQRQQVPQEEQLQMKPLANSITPLVQREEIPEEEEEELQMKSLDNSTLQRELAPEEEEEEELQMKSLDNSTLQRESAPEEEEEEEELQMKSLDNSTLQRESAPEEEEEEELQMKSLDDNTLQRESAPEEEEEEELQMKSLDDSTLQRESAPEEEEEELQMKPMVQRQAKGAMAATPNLEASINQAKGGGQPMADNIRQPMEQAFGADFSGVKVHTDSQSDELNQSIQARAFTTGQDVFFRQGEYNPESRGGQELLAHELTHVVQQNDGMVQRYFIHGDEDERQTEEQVRNACLTAGLNEQQTDWVWSNRGSDKQKRRLQNWIDRASNSGAKEERGTKRSKEEEEDSTEGIEVGGTLNEMMEELKQRKTERSYADNIQIHKILKDEPDLACFNWALRGLSETGGPLPDDFWNVIQGALGANKQWMTSLDQEIRVAIEALTRKIAKNKLTYDDYLETFEIDDEGGFRNAQKQKKAREIMIEACQLIVKSNGMTPVDDSVAEAWVVCQYKKVMGAASPEHWWIELPGGIGERLR